MRGNDYEGPTKEEYAFPPDLRCPPRVGPLDLLAFLPALEGKVQPQSGKPEAKGGDSDLFYRKLSRSIWYRALSFADWKKIEKRIIIGHDHAYGSWVPEYRPQLWNGGSILDDRTYLAVTDGVPELKKV